jgi:hypothetical protein
MHGRADVNVFRHVVLVKPETLVTQQVGNVVDAAGQQIVKTDHLVAQIQEGIAQMAPQESGSARYHNAHSTPPAAGYLLLAIDL